MKRNVLISLSCVLASMLLIAGCGAGGGSTDLNSFDDFFKDPSGEPIKATVRTTVPLAYATSVAMATNTCSSYPCFETILIDAHTLPLPFTSSGQIAVAGLWTSPQTAILTVIFVDMFAGSSLFQVHDVSTFPVTTTPAGIKIVYTNIDVNIATGPVSPDSLSDIEIQALFLQLTIGVSDEPAVNLNMDAWVVDVDQAGTLNDFSDDTYTINGGGQYIDASSGSASILQLGMARTVMAPDECSLNPVDGFALLNEVDASSSGLPVIATAFLTFESACTGAAEVTIATGNYILSNGKSIPLYLDVP